MGREGKIHTRLQKVKEKKRERGNSWLGHTQVVLSRDSVGPCVQSRVCKVIKPKKPKIQRREFLFVFHSQSFSEPPFKRKHLFLLVVFHFGAFFHISIFYVSKIMGHIGRPRVQTILPSKVIVFRNYSRNIKNGKTLEKRRDDNKLLGTLLFSRILRCEFKVQACMEGARAIHGFYNPIVSSHIRVEDRKPCGNVRTLFFPMLPDGFLSETNLRSIT